VRARIALLLAPVVAGALALSPARASTTAAARTRPIISVGANKSNNWSGYNRGALEHPTSPQSFSAVTGDWVVPTATQHSSADKSGEFSATWLGIGGGCIDALCLTTDSTLIQAGTSADVDGSGKASYLAWWEIIPAPSITISNMTVSAGDHMHVSIAEAVPLSNVWTITVQDLTRGETFSQTVPYTSTHATVEWITETPVVLTLLLLVQIGPMPNLSTVTMSNTTVNGAATNLVPSEAIQLVDLSLHPLATPSDPFGTGLALFNDCTYASTCPTGGGGGGGSSTKHGHKKP
jgi:Peptidase A4 family